MAPPTTSSQQVKAALLAGTGLVALCWTLKSVQAWWQRRKTIEELLGPKDRDGKRRTLLAIDIGSSSIRCGAYLLTGDGVKYIPQSMMQKSFTVLGPLGTAKADVILKAVEEVVTRCLSFLRRHNLHGSIEGVGFAVFVMNMVGVDEQGKAVTEVYTYADQHPGTVEHATRLRTSLRDRLNDFYQLTGTPIHTAYAPAQISRLAQEEPEVLRKVAKWQTLSSYILSHWTGIVHLAVSYSEASWTGLLDFRRLVWCDGLIKELPVNRSTFPNLADFSAPLPRLKGAYARRWPELAEARLFLGVGDGACANVGSHCYDSSRMAVTVGTSAAARIIVDARDAQRVQKFKVPAGLWCYRVDQRRLLLGGALTDGGSLVKWLCDTLHIDSARSEALAKEMEPDAHGVTFLPFLSGERAPGWNDNAQAAMAGLTKNTTAEMLYRAGLEAIALRLGAIVALMASSSELPPDAVIGASGTGLQASPLWREIMADVLNRPLMLGKEGEATSLGVATLMAEALLGKDVAQPYQVSSRHDPSPQRHQVYKAALVRQVRLYDALINKDWASGDH